MNKKFYIYGASYPDTIKVLESIYREKNIKVVQGFIDDVKYNKEKNFMNLPILGNSSFLSTLAPNSLVVNNVHSNTTSRLFVNNKIINAGFIPASVISPNINLSSVNVGIGVFMHDGVLVGANVLIGNYTSIKIGAAIAHDVKIGSYAFIGPNATLCGHVNIACGAYIGAGSVIKERVSIGTGAIVGAGSVVLKDVDPWTVVVGNPAKVIRTVTPISYVTK